MNKVSHYLVLSLFASCILITACNDEAPKEEKTITIKTDSTVQPAKTNTVVDSSVSLKARFVNFEMGDAAHFLFKDEKGKSWDFADNEDTMVRFDIELSAAKANEKNQGFLSNKALEGKWFILQFVYRTEPEYPDGPVGKLPVIIKARNVNK